MQEIKEKAITETGRFRKTSLYDRENPFILECGLKLFPVDVAFETYGTLSSEKDNVIVIFHALTGNAHAASLNADDDQYSAWWDGLIGPGKGIDTNRYYVICANLLGSCYGTTGPLSINPESNEIYGSQFPDITTRDMCRVYRKLLESMEIETVIAATGGSLGGMLVWQFAVDYPDMVKKAIPIAGTPAASAWVIGFNEVARVAITNQSDWEEKWQDSGESPGLKLARMIAMLTYRSEISLDIKFGRKMQIPAYNNPFNQDNPFQIQSYLRYQGEKLVRRFNPYSYLTLTKAMDLHDIRRGYDSLEEALSRIRSEMHIIGIDTDRLFPASELRNMATILNHVGKISRYYEISSFHGHDAFLIEFRQLNQLIKEILEE